MATKYPIVLVHGIAAKQLPLFNAFGKIDRELKKEGYKVYVSNHDGFGSIENNAMQLKDFILSVMEKCQTDKVNIIAHSKGGLDSKHMITELGMEDHVASLTTICTPHQGSLIASKIYNLPYSAKIAVSSVINDLYLVLGRDKHPDSLRVCEQLCSVDTYEEVMSFSNTVYCQSYSTNITEAKDCVVMALPMNIQNRALTADNDGLVSEDSTKFGVYRGSCLDTPVSHVQIIDFCAKKRQRKMIYSFYNQVCADLEKMGF